MSLEVGNTCLLGSLVIDLAFCTKDELKRPDMKLSSLSWAHHKRRQRPWGSAASFQRPSVEDDCPLLLVYQSVRDEEDGERASKKQKEPTAVHSPLPLLSREEGHLRGDP